MVYLCFFLWAIGVALVVGAVGWLILSLTNPINNERVNTIIGLMEVIDNATKKLNKELEEVNFWQKYLLNKELKKRGWSV